MALATADNMLARYDERVIRDLLSDDGSKVTGSISSNPKLLELLESASGYVLAAASNGSNYTEAELAGLTGSAAALLADIVCMIAMVKLMRRRGNKMNHEILREWNDSAEQYLDQLRKGQRIFPVAEHQAAGLMTVGGPSVVQIQNMNLITNLVPNFYPAFWRRLPLNRLGGG